MVKKLLQQEPTEPNSVRPKLGNVSILFAENFIVDLEQTHMLALTHKKTEDEAQTLQM